MKPLQGQIALQASQPGGGCDLYAQGLARPGEEVLGLDGGKLTQPRPLALGQGEVQNACAGRRGFAAFETFVAEDAELQKQLRRGLGAQEILTRAIEAAVVQLHGSAGAEGQAPEEKAPEHDLDDERSGQKAEAPARGGLQGRYEKARRGDADLAAGRPLLEEPAKGVEVL